MIPLFYAQLNTYIVIFTSSDEHRPPRLLAAADTWYNWI